MKSFKRLVVFMLVLSMVIGTMVPAFAFSDVEDTTYEDEINKLAAVGVVNGDPEGTFRPEDNITRAEVAVIICKMLGAGNTMDAQKNMPSKFSDVATGEWYTGAVNLATGNGIIAGFPDGTFRPNDNITVAQAVTLMVKALGRGAYVDAAGQWPANYIAEGAKLGVTANVVAGGQDDLATRGVVSAMAWNSLDIPVWDVYETTHNGEIVSSATDTMLALYFKDFVTENGDLKWAEDIEVADTYITRKDIASNQIVLNYAEVQEAISGSTLVKGDFEAKVEDRVKDKEVKTYVDGADLIVYVADENVSVASLANKEIDIMFGKDNVATLVIVREDAETDVLVKYLADDKEIVVGAETYEIAKNDVEIIVNGEVIYDAATIAETEAVIAEIVTKVNGAVNTKPISKVIKVDVGATSGNKIEKLVFEVSGNYSFDFATVDVEVTQFIVKEIKNDKIKKIENSTSKAINIDIDDLADEDDVITVIKDGEEVELTDIAAGDVVTYTGLIKDAAVMYVSSARATGTVDKIKTTKEIVVAGESYYANGTLIGSLSNDIEEAEAFDTEKLHNVVEEEVELYFNYLGEYVAVLTDAEGGVWNFGVVKDIKENDDEEDLRLKLRILTEDGSNKSFYVVEDDEDVNTGKLFKTSTNNDSAYAPLAENLFVGYKVTGEDQIDVEDLIIIDGPATNFMTVGDKTYSAIEGNGTSDYDYKEVAGKDYNDETIIFNLGGAEKVEVVDDIKAVIGKGLNNTIVDAGDLVIFDKDNDVKFIVLDGGDAYLSSDSDFAYVTNIYGGADNKWYVDLYVEGTEMNDVEATSKPSFLAGSFIKYELTGKGKLDLSKTDLVIDVNDINGLVDTTKITDEVAENGTVEDVVILAGAYGDKKEDLVVDTCDGLKVTFEDSDVAAVKLLAEDDAFDGVIYDLSGDEPAMVEDLADIDGEIVIIIDSKDDSKTFGDIIIIVKSTTK